MDVSAPLIEIDHMVAEIQSMPALRGLSLRVPQATIVSLIGRNGVREPTLVPSTMGHLTATQSPIPCDG